MDKEIIKKWAGKLNLLPQEVRRIIAYLENEYGKSIWLWGESIVFSRIEEYMEDHPEEFEMI